MGNILHPTPWSDKVRTARVDGLKSLTGFRFAELKAKVFPRRTTFLEREGQPIIQSGSLGEIYADRGVGKTWVARSLALAMASGRSVLGFNAPEPVRVLYIDGEMASEDIRERDARLAEWLKLSTLKRPPQLMTVAADWQEDYLPRLDTPEGQKDIDPFVDEGEVIILDNRSCLLDPAGERDPVAWEPTLRWLLSLRRRGKAVLLVHHANRLGGARGISNAEDPLNVIIGLTRPADYEAQQGARFDLSFEKNRGFTGAAAAPFTARLDAEGWVIEPPNLTQKEERIKRKLLNALGGKQRIASFNDAAEASHVNRNSAAPIWKRLLDGGEISKQDGRYVVVQS